MQNYIYENHIKNPTESNIDQIIVVASDWVNQLAELYQNTGRTLYAAEIKIAHEVGVMEHQHIRIIEIVQVPEPNNLALLELRLGNGQLHSYMLGLTLGYQVFIKKGFISDHLLAHEFRHVYQFEQAGSMEKMIQNYLREVLQFGYIKAPLEIDAVDASRAFLK